MTATSAQLAGKEIDQGGQAKSGANEPLAGARCIIKGGVVPLTTALTGAFMRSWHYFRLPQ
jgi:hypothetical protein